MATVTRKEIEEVLNRGESFLLGDRHITSKDQIPTDEDLAGGDRERQTQIDQEISRQIEELQARQRRLRIAPAAALATTRDVTQGTTAVPGTSETVPSGPPGNPSAPRVDAEDMPGQGVEEKQEHAAQDRSPDGPQLPASEKTVVAPQDPRKPSRK